MNLLNECGCTVFPRITNKSEVAFIKSFFNSNNKASDPNSTLHSTLFFWKTELVDGRFITGVFHLSSKL